MLPIAIPVPGTNRAFVLGEPVTEHDRGFLSAIKPTNPDRRRAMAVYADYLNETRGESEALATGLRWASNHDFYPHPNPLGPIRAPWCWYRWGPRLAKKLWAAALPPPLYDVMIGGRGRHMATAATALAAFESLGEAVAHLVKTLDNPRGVVVAGDDPHEEERDGEPQ